MSEDDEPDQPGQSGYYLKQCHPVRQDRAVDYNLTAAHGWEFLLDNHLEMEADRRRAVRHAVVLGEN